MHVLQRAPRFQLPHKSSFGHHRHPQHVHVRKRIGECTFHRKYQFSTKIPANPPDIETIGSHMLPSTLELANGVLQSKRAQLAKAITLVESSRIDHQIQANWMVMYVLQKHKEMQKRKRYRTPLEFNSFRIGISGPPGVGKSTFIDALGSYLVSKNYKVAVLAVDPSSARTGGSILGDITRMSELSKSPNAYIRGSPSRGTLGGVTRTTGDVIVLCEAAGYNVVLVETVGVGQSETAVEDMTDFFVMLAPPAGGDELQGIKKGIMELVDMVIINKADGELIPAAKRAQAEIATALHMIKPKWEQWTPQVECNNVLHRIFCDQFTTVCSSVEKEQIETVWNVMYQYWQALKETGYIIEKRGKQRQSWMWKILNEELIRRFEQHEQVKKILPVLEEQVKQGELTPSIAIDRLIETFLQSPSGS